MDAMTAASLSFCLLLFIAMGIVNWKVPLSNVAAYVLLILFYVPLSIVAAYVLLILFYVIFRLTGLD